MKLSFLLLFVMFSLAALSQEKALPMDENGKYTFLEVTELPLVSKSMMAANVKRFFKANSKSLKAEANNKDTAFYGKGKMIIQKAVIGIGHPSGEVTYSINIALREGKYRLILTNFVLVPYERDRYSNYVPGTVSSPLENKPGKLNLAEWESNLNSVAIGARKMADKLKVTMGNTQSEPKQEPNKPVVISTKNW